MCWIPTRTSHNALEFVAFCHGSPIHQKKTCVDKPHTCNSCLISLLAFELFLRHPMRFDDFPVADDIESYSVSVSYFMVDLRILALPERSNPTTTVRVAVIELPSPSIVVSLYNE
jgi:hypothetical protein